MRDSIEYQESIALNKTSDTKTSDTEWIRESIINEIRSARDSIANMACRDGTSEGDRKLLMVAVSSIDWLIINYCALDKAYNQLRREL